MAREPVWVPTRTKYSPGMLLVLLGVAVVVVVVAMFIGSPGVWVVAVGGGGGSSCRESGSIESVVISCPAKKSARRMSHWPASDFGSCSCQRQVCLQGGERHTFRVILHNMDIRIRIRDDEM
jgi:hypothetical protein